MTTGTSIGLLIRNTDQRSKDYGDIAETFRPGHADYTYWMKFGQRDYRGGGRSSARLTAQSWRRAPWRRSGWRSATVSRYAVTAQIGDIAIPFESHDNVNDNSVFRPSSRGLAETGRAGKLHGRAAQSGDELWREDLRRNHRFAGRLGRTALRPTLTPTLHTP